MAASSRTSPSPTSSKSRGWFTTGKKVSVTPSKSLVHLAEDEEVYSIGPARKMKQVRKSKSEKGKLKIYASAQELGVRNTKWHISLPNVHDTREPTTSPSSSPPLPPPPSNPPPILQALPELHAVPPPRGRELVKSASAGAINVVTPMRGPGRLPSPQGSPPVNPEKTKEENGKLRRGPPPVVPPPYSAKARAATVISAVIQEHVQSSTRSAPGNLQNTPEVEQRRNSSTTGTSPSTSERLLKSESVKGVGSNAARTGETSKPQPPVKPDTTSTVDESPLTASTEGGVKSLARFFSARSKEGLKTQPPSPKHSPNVQRQKKGREILRRGLKKASSIPETCKEEENEPEESGEQRKPSRLPPIRSISNDPDEKYEMLHSVASPGSPTHMSLFSWYNPPESKFDATKRCVQNPFETSTSTTKEETSFSPNSPTYKEYQNVLVETATLVGGSPSDPLSSREGSHKEKKPVPLPRTLSKERGICVPRVRERHLATSDSDGALSIPSPQSSLSNLSSEYIDMAREQDTTADGGENEARESPDMVVLGSLDPEWRDNFEELIQQEIEMTDGFSDSDEEGEESQTRVSSDSAPPTGQLIVSHASFVVNKAALKKTQSHNQNGPNIQRRNTPKEKRELRKGICSESDQVERDEYVRMNSASDHTNNTPLPSQGTSKMQSEATSSLTVPKLPPGMDPQSSGYYLKILPSTMVKPPEESLTVEAPTPVKHFYIEIDVPGDPSEQGAPQGEQHEPNGPTLPQKLSPAHKPTRALVFEANKRQKLKYPKISVGTSTEDAKVVDGKKGRKTPYSHVKVEGQAAENTTDEHPHAALGRQRSQGSIFAKEMMNYVHRPLPPTPPEGAVYYKTVNHPLGHVPAMRQVWHHEYIEIDESELNQKHQDRAPHKAPEGWLNIHAAGGPVRVHETKKRSLTTHVPPPVPQRPSCPYVEIDGDELEELAASLPLASRAAVSVGPRAARKLGPPPTVPGRPDATIRHHSFSSSGDYAYPAIPGLMFEWLKMRRAVGDRKGYFTPRVPLPSSHPGHRHVSSGKKSLMDTIDEKEFATDSPPTVPPKTESLLREQMGFLAKQSVHPSPYLVPVTTLHKEPSYDHLASEVPSPERKRPKSPKEVISNLRRELLLEDRVKDEKSTPLPPHLAERKKAMIPPQPPLPYKTIVEAKEKASGRHNPPKVPTKMRRANRDDTSGYKAQGLLLRDERTSSVNGEGSPPESLAVRKDRLQDRIDRNSLAMIMRNKSAIAEKLEKETDSPKPRRKVMQAAKDEGDASVVRSLGDILLDVDALLHHRMCSEDDLIAAIEQQLNIKLMRRPLESGSVENNGDGSSDGTRLDDSVHVTEQDVKEVVTFMNNSQASPDETQAESREEETDGWVSESVKTTQEGDTLESEEFGSPKRRSSTVIVTDGSAHPYHRSIERTEAVQLPDARVGHGRNSDDDDGEEETREKQMRDSRSSSVGLRPLRRVMARRKTNPAGDMANLSAGKSSTPHTSND